MENISTRRVEQGKVSVKTRFAAAVPRVTSDITDNLDKILSLIYKASSAGADIVLFPEAALTGLILTDDYQRDSKLTLPIESSPVQTIFNSAANQKIWTAFGFLELSGATIFDSGLLVDKAGRVVLHQRRMSAGWRAGDANPSEYGSGNSLSVAMTPWGRTAILICGDLFEPAVLSLAADAKLDLLLFPFARCFRQEITAPQKEWDHVEFPVYSARIKQIGALTLMANYIASVDFNGGAFGGGFVAHQDGQALATKPLFEEGILVWDSA